VTTGRSPGGGAGGRRRPRRPAGQGELAALVLAGGYSARMQGFKPLLPFAGATVLERSVGTFLEAGVERVSVVVGHRGEELLPIVERLRVRAVVNPAFDEGMFSSVVAGVGSLPPEVGACFILPADMPAVRSRTVSSLARAWRRTDAPVLYPTFRGEQGHPPLVSRRLFPDVLGATGEGGLRHVLAGSEPQAYRVEVLDEGVVLDLDTPADYDAACRELGDRTVPSTGECLALLAQLGAPEHLVRHGRAVADLAGRIGAGLLRAGERLDLPLLRAAALLHDVAKGTPDHTRVGALRLARLGFPRVAAVVAAHTDLPVEELRRLSEAAVLYLADKLTQGDHPVSLAERFRLAAAKLGKLGDSGGAAGPAFRGAPRDSAEAREAMARRLRDACAVAARVESVLGAGALDGLASESSAALDPGRELDGQRG
jgi:molybdenum cofactor cytidylyltransferase